MTWVSDEKIAGSIESEPARALEAPREIREIQHGRRIRADRLTKNRRRGASGNDHDVAVALVSDEKIAGSIESESARALEAHREIQHGRRIRADRLTKNRRVSARGNRDGSGVVVRDKKIARTIEDDATGPLKRSARRERDLLHRNGRGCTRGPREQCDGSSGCDNAAKGRSEYSPRQRS